MEVSKLDRKCETIMKLTSVLSAEVSVGLKDIRIQLLQKIGTLENEMKQMCAECEKEQVK